MKYIWPVIRWCVDYYWIFLGIGCAIVITIFVSMYAECARENGVLVKGLFEYTCIEKGLH